MDVQLTPSSIRLWCGKNSYVKGESYYQTGKVTFTYTDSDTGFYTATVKGKSTEQVTVKIDSAGDVFAECTCPTLSSYDLYCQHIAAVLLNIHDIQQRSEQEEEPISVSAGETQLTNFMLELFAEKTIRTTHKRKYFDSRTPLDVEFTCKPIYNGYRKYIFGIEIKIGPSRLYVVKNVSELLDVIEREETYVFSNLFTYDPEIHCFSKENDAVIRHLIAINNSEEIYQELAIMEASQRNRLLMIPPIYWNDLLLLFMKAQVVKLAHGDFVQDGISVSDETIPIRFEFDHNPGQGYYLDIQGLDAISIMESYGVVLFGAKLVKLPDEEIKRLAELKHMVVTSHKPYIRIAQEQLDIFMEKVIPGLMKIGSVHIAKAVSERMVQTPLKAKLYLDRVKDRLLAGLEFHYGGVIINPLDEENNQQRGDDRILMRDGDLEMRILDLMDQSPFAKSETGYFLADEDAEYDFLYKVVPQMQKLVEVYATTAVKARIHYGLTSPKITVDMDSRHDWLEFKFDIDGIPEQEIRHLLKSLEEKSKYYRLSSGALVPLEGEKFQEMLRFMNEAGIGTGKMTGPDIRLPVIHGLKLLDYQDTGKTIRLSKSFRRLLENMRNPDLMDYPLPESLTSVLRDYQQYGYQWMKTLANYRFGGILADDMGLGKTLQSIAFIVSVLPEIRREKMPALIVAPASLVYNWRNELKKFAPEVIVNIVDGTQEERSRMVKNVSGVDVLITSYPLIRRDFEYYAGSTFHTLILDEAQTFKNHTTQTAQTVRRIRARHRFALTGTPVENSIDELWSIFDVVFPELFTSRKVFANLSRDNVAKRIRPFLLRRLKSDVLKELPDKIESIQVSELLPEQKKFYVAYLAELKHETVKHLKEKSFQKNRIKILAGLTRLRQLCCHPALFVPEYTGSSAKFEQLLEIIEECRSAGKRMLVFSQFTEMLGLIRREMGRQGIPYFYLDGQTPVSDRVELCNRFNEGEHDLFLISLKAGGTGLNLTGADTVILYDLWWNPAVEEQAADRAHRIGQKKVVQVIRLVAQGTVEEKMHELQQKKRNLIDEVIQPGQQELSLLSEDEIREILMIE
ncbi:DEAD/DEAH box helicase [Paenibacillus antarcticus]|uniref:Helicase SNF n=1 Tax=Paenibacillus antarcticus TaxID=253703 RepID=A0A168MPM2_9BACL|nr:DEAD/DEAH box helicase [Paenibacillus antarcticus]OAB44914.1 helicase SNF [Paenibacillus antarcticus]